MKFAIVFLSIFVAASSVYAFRCGPGGRNIAREGMHKYQVLKDCGQPISRETIGLDRSGGSYRFIEEWVYIEEDYGRKQMYIIRFNEKGIAGEIEWLGEQK